MKKCLIIDNYDSYTYNIYQIIYNITNTEPEVIFNDEYDKIINKINNLEDFYDYIIISPGPGRPENDNDVGISKRILEQTKVPVLGVCLGHQLLGHMNSLKVINAKEIMHGRISEINHYNDSLFHNIPNKFNVVRYHSLLLENNINKNLEIEIIAKTNNDEIMGIKHKKYPFYGIQFHPESICTEYGQQLFANFINISNNKFLYKKIKSEELVNNSERIFFNLFKKEKYWLDRSQNNIDNNNFSIMGEIGGKLWKKCCFDLPNKLIEYDNQYNKKTLNITIWDYLKNNLDIFKDVINFPFDFTGGFIGYLGYEMNKSQKRYNNGINDSIFYLVDRFILLDHQNKDVYIVDNNGTYEWINQIHNKLKNLSDSINIPEKKDLLCEFKLSDSKEEYIQKIKDCKSCLYNGESYELCLTTQFVLNNPPDPDLLFYNMRIYNPAPYATYINFENNIKICSSSPERFLNFSKNIIEAKPIKGTIKRGKNIKEDTELKEELRNSEKDKAENLMVVDMLRNDLGKLCENGSVVVEKLFNIETFASVHQMVSTIKGKVNSKVNQIDIIKSIFPGGSMTGAPKIRSINILEEIERRSRGVYSGIMGYISYSNNFDMNIVIRTCIINNNKLTIGTGGAITILSDEEAEYQEILLKGSAILKCISNCSINNNYTLSYENSSKLIYDMKKYDLFVFKEKNYKIICFDSFKVDKGSAIMFEEHINRLKEYISLLSLDICCSDIFIEKVRNRLKYFNGFPRIEIILFNENIHFLLSLRKMPILHNIIEINNIEIDTREKPEIKGYDYDKSNEIYKKKGETIFINKKNYILEGIYSSIVWWEEDTLCCIKNKNKLKSITLKAILGICNKLKIEYQEKDIKLEKIKRYELWFLNSLHGIRRIITWKKEYNKKRFDDFFDNLKLKFVNL
jgi:para-aminobenzoate synthetase